MEIRHYRCERLCDIDHLGCCVGLLASFACTIVSLVWQNTPKRPSYGIYYGLEDNRHFSIAFVDPCTGGRSYSSHGIATVIAVSQPLHAKYNFNRIERRIMALQNWLSALYRLLTT